MIKYTVNLSITVEANSEQEARRYIFNQLSKGRWNEAKITSIQRQTSAAMQKYAGNRGLRTEMNVFDDPILPKFDENNLDVECVWQTWKNIVEDYVKGEN